MRNETQRRPLRNPLKAGFRKLNLAYNMTPNQHGAEYFHSLMVVGAICNRDRRDGEGRDCNAPFAAVKKTTRSMRYRGATPRRSPHSDATDLAVKRNSPWRLAMALLAWVLIGVAIVLYLRRPLPETDPAVTAAASARGGLDRQDPAGGREIPFAAGLLRFVQTPWVGDLDGMLERRLIRVLIVPSETMYFLDRGRTSGIVAECASRRRRQRARQARTRA